MVMYAKMTSDKLADVTFSVRDGFLWWKTYDTMTRTAFRTRDGMWCWSFSGDYVDGRAREQIERAERLRRFKEDNA